MDIQQVAGWVSFEQACFVGAVILLFLVAWRIGIASLASAAVAFYLAPFMVMHLEQSFLGGVVASLPWVGKFVAVFVILYVLLRRLLGEEYSYPSYLYLSVATVGSIGVVLGTITLSPGLSGLIPFPQVFTMVCTPSVALLWVLGGLVLLGIARRGYFV